MIISDELFSKRGLNLINMKTLWVVEYGDAYKTVSGEYWNAFVSVNLQSWVPTTSFVGMETENRNAC